MASRWQKVLGFYCCHSKYLLLMFLLLSFFCRWMEEMFPNVLIRKHCNPWARHLSLCPLKSGNLTAIQTWLLQPPLTLVEASLYPWELHLHQDLMLEFRRMSASWASRKWCPRIIIRSRHQEQHPPWLSATNPMSWAASRTLCYSIMVLTTVMKKSWSQGWIMR